MATEHYNSKTSKPYAVIFTLQATQTLNENTPRDYRIPRVVENFNLRLKDHHRISFISADFKSSLIFPVMSLNHPAVLQIINYDWHFHVL
jgi:DNA polymerase III alpha subunit (gram-positive type)